MAGAVWYSSRMHRPTGITIIAGVFFAAGVYLVIVGLTQLISPGTFSYGRQTVDVWAGTGGPVYGAADRSGICTGCWGLFRLNKFARWAAMGVMAIGIGWLVPKISMAELGVPVFWFGLQIALRVAVAWYLSQAPSVVDAFAGKA